PATGRPRPGVQHGANAAAADGDEAPGPQPTGGAGVHLHPALQPRTDGGAVPGPGVRRGRVPARRELAGRGANSPGGVGPDAGVDRRGAEEAGRPVTLEVSPMRDLLLWAADWWL